MSRGEPSEPLEPLIDRAPISAYTQPPSSPLVPTTRRPEGPGCSRPRQGSQHGSPSQTPPQRVAPQHRSCALRSCSQTRSLHPVSITKTAMTPGRYTSGRADQKARRSSGRRTLIELRYLYAPNIIPPNKMRRKTCILPLSMSLSPVRHDPHKPQPAEPENYT